MGMVIQSWLDMEENAVHCVSNKTGKNEKVQLSHQDYPRDTCQQQVTCAYEMFSFTFHMISNVLYVVTW